jgi:hypothetical protein
MTTPPPGYGPPPGWDPGTGPTAPTPPSAGGPWTGQPGGPQPLAGGPWAPAGGQPETSTKAVVALVLAIAAYTVVPFVAAIVAVFLARSAKREIRASGGRLGGEGLATAAFWIATVHLVFVALLFLVLFLLVVVFGAFSIGSLSFT